MDLSVAQGRHTGPSHLAPALVVGAVAFALARLALLPGVAFWDTGEFQTIGPVLGTAHPTGFPTYVLLGWLASVLFQPFGDEAFRMNLLSALCLGVAAAVTVDLVRALTRSVALGVAAGLALALTPIAWSIGTHADPHVLHLTLVAILLRLLVGWDDRVRGGDRSWTAPDPHADRWLVAAAIVFGLAVGNHSLTLLLAIPVGLYVLAVEPGILRRPRLILICLVALVATVALVYLELPLRAGPFRAPLVYGHPETWEGFWYVVLAEQFRGSLQDPFGDLAGKMAALVRLTVAEFGVLAPVVPIAFILTALRKPRYALLTGTSVLITCFFAASYENADISRYYLGPVADGLDLARHPRRAPRGRRRGGHRRLAATAPHPAHGGVAARRDHAGRAVPAGRAQHVRLDRRERRPQGGRLDGPGARHAGAERHGRQLVELLDAVVVRPDRRRPAA